MVKSFQIKRFTEDAITPRDDLLAVEEPLEIILTYWTGYTWKEKTLIITMRTPGNDAELAIGFMYAEGVIHTTCDIQSMRHCLKSSHLGNTLKVQLSKNCDVDFSAFQRNFYAHAGCGVCGKTSIESIQNIHCSPVEDVPIQVSSSILHQLPAQLQNKQHAFNYTGGIHAAALFDKAGNLLMVREDIGRHNALDKLLGAAIKQYELPLSEHILVVSGRASFELVQKAVSAGIPIMAAIGAPSSLAVDLATSFNMTLIGFLKSSRLNVYCGGKRIILNEQHYANPEST